MAETIFQKPLDAQVALNTDAIANIVHRKEYDVSGTTIDNQDSGIYYKQVLSIPSGYTILNAYWSASWDANVSMMFGKASINLVAPNQKTLGSNRKIMVLYISDNYIKTDT